MDKAEWLQTEAGAVLKSEIVGYSAVNPEVDGAAYQLGFRSFLLLKSGKIVSTEVPIVDIEDELFGKQPA